MDEGEEREAWKQRLKRRFRPKWRNLDVSVHQEERRKLENVSSFNPTPGKYNSYKKQTRKPIQADFLPRLCPVMIHDVLPLEKFFWNILSEEVFSDLLLPLVQDAVEELCEEYLQNEAAFHLINQLTSEILEGQDGRSLVNEVLNEEKEKSFLEKEIIDPVVSGMFHEMAEDTIKESTKEKLQRDSKEVLILAEEKLLDSFILEELFSLLAQDGHLWLESEEEDRILDGFILDSLLNELLKFQESKTFIEECNPFRELHKRIVTDIELDVILHQLTSSLLEDERQLENFERETKMKNISFLEEK